VEVLEEKLKSAEGKSLYYIICFMRKKKEGERNTYDIQSD